MDVCRPGQYGRERADVDLAGIVDDGLPVGAEVIAADLVQEPQRGGRVVRQRVRMVLRRDRDAHARGLVAEPDKRLDDPAARLPFGGGAAELSRPDAYHARIHCAREFEHLIADACVVRAGAVIGAERKHLQPRHAGIRGDLGCGFGSAGQNMAVSAPFDAVEPGAGGEPDDFLAGELTEGDGSQPCFPHG